MSNLIYIDGELYHAEDFSTEELLHYGVPGMKWGKRKAAKQERSNIRQGTKQRIQQNNVEYSRSLKKLESKHVGVEKKLVSDHKAGKIDSKTFEAKRAKNARDYQDLADNLSDKYTAKNIKTKLKGRELERGTVGKKSTVRKAAEKFNDRQMKTLLRQLDTNQGLRDNNKTIMRSLESGKINQKQARALLSANQLAAANGRRINF